ncbi:MAG: 1-(5-phosphoribosyl)-5-[(5-phosphoribosylamino)methylideneamino]imidazole-4-carboxamide isomerase [Oscillospiraceae bacterium]|nr:1-(5-phosphoribosyl)-5-[(5-phosphoribosylamino)methylideneamino]imidazole-4-carboxamide isomerase [Oscillospiraceae bacterium]
MLLFPAIDLFQGKAVRLYKGDYEQMTVYSEHPEEIAEDFAACGATCIHIVDLEGARNGETPNLETVCRIVKRTGLFAEIGGGIRSDDTIRRYLDAGLSRVILGTAAVNDRVFLQQSAKKYGEKLAVGVDIRDGKVAIKGWTEKSALDAFEFCRYLQEIGIGTVICTDISKDGAMSGTNHSLYEQLRRDFRMKITASGGVSSLDDVRRLAAMDLYGAIIGKAYYTGAIDLRQAVKAAEL